MPTFHHQPLPDHSTLLSGPRPPEAVGWCSDQLQIWYNNTAEPWADSGEHYHQDTDECFIVLRGALDITVGGEPHTIGPREFCCFPRGVYHAVVAVHPPVETLMIRAPAGADKVYRAKAPQVRTPADESRLMR